MMTHTDTPTLAELSVDDLAARARCGDEACFQELARRLRAPLAAFVVRRLPSPADADDVVQETLLRAYRHIDRYDPTRRFSTWLFAIGKNVASNHRAAHLRRTDLEQRGGRESETVAVQVAVGPAARAADDLWRTAQRLLSGEAYRALWLRYAEDLSVGEIARELGRTAVSTKVMLFRARRKLLQEGS